VAKNRQTKSKMITKWNKQNNFDIYMASFTLIFPLENSCLSR